MTSCLQPAAACAWPASLPWPLLCSRTCSQYHQQSPLSNSSGGPGSPSSSSCAGAASSSGSESSSRRRSSGNSSSSSSGGEGNITGTQHTLNNAMGFTLPYGGLQHVASFDEVTPSMVNSALAGAKFLGNRFDKSKGEICFWVLWMSVHWKAKSWSSSVNMTIDDNSHSLHTTTPTACAAVPRLAFLHSE